MGATAYNIHFIASLQTGASDAQHRQSVSAMEEVMQYLLVFMRDLKRITAEFNLPGNTIHCCSYWQSIPHAVIAVNRHRVSVFIAALFGFPKADIPLIFQD
jgi:hypothetical protein